jgi:hypothetical protein
MSCPHLNLTNIRVKQHHATSCLVNEEISGDDIQWKARKESMGVLQQILSVSWRKWLILIRVLPFGWSINKSAAGHPKRVKFDRRIEEPRVWQVPLHLLLDKLIV